MSKSRESFLGECNDPVEKQQCCCPYCCDYCWDLYLADHPVALQDGKAPEWTCPTCGQDALWCGH